MATLTIMITTETEQDYDGVDETIKRICGDIDGEHLPLEHSEEDTVTDADCKTNFKNFTLDLNWL